MALVVTHDLVVLVPLPGDEHKVAGTSEPDLDLRRADQAGAEGEPRSAEREHALGARERRLDLYGVDVGGRRPADSHAASLDRICEAGAGGIVDVHDRDRIGFSARRKMLEKEPGLGAIVALRVTMKI